MTPAEPLYRDRRFLAEWLVLLGVLLSLGGYLGYLEYKEYRQAGLQEQNRLATQAAVIEKNVVPQLLLANRVLDGILTDLPGWRAENDGFRRANRQLQIINDAMIGMRPILVIDADGTVLASSNEKLVGMNFAQRQYFRTAIINPDPKILHVSAPFTTVLDSFVISLFRTIPGADGKFGGIVIASLIPEHFSTLLDSVRYAPDMRTSIAHGDGRLFLTLPQNTETNGTDLAKPGSFFIRHRESGLPANVFTGITHVTGDERMMALRTIQLPAMDKPLLVAASRDLAIIFAPWRRTVFMQGILLGAMAVLSTLGLLLVQRRRRDQFRERKLTESRIRDLLAEQRLIFDNAHVGIVMLNRRRIVKCNRRQAEIFGYAGPEAIEGRTTEIFYCSTGEFEAIGDLLYPDMAKHGFAQIEAEMCRQDGSRIWIMMSGRPLDPTAVLDGSIWVYTDITERKKADQKFRDLLESAPDAMLIVNSAAEVVLVNIQTLKLFGWSRENLLGRNIDMLMPERFRGQHRGNGDAFFAQPQARAMGSGRELFGLRKDGTEFPIEISLSPLQTDEGSFVISAIRDISVRQAAEQETRRLANRLTTTLESITDALYIVDRNWHFTYLNGEAERMFQQRREELIGSVLWVAFPPLLGTRFEDAYRRAMSGGSATTFDAFYAPWNIWLRASAYPSAEGLTVYLRDITAEHAEHRQLELLEASVARLNDMVVITEAAPDAEAGRRIVFVNDAFVRLTGHAREDVLGKSPRLLHGPRTDQAEVKRIYAALARFEPVHAELVNYRKSGEAYWGEFDIVPISLAGEAYSHFVAIERDVTESKRVQDELQALNAELESRVQTRTAELSLAREDSEQANRAKSDFLAVMSHEIRTPMNGVVGMIDVLAHGQLSSEQTEIVRIARESAYSLLAIVDDVLDFSKIEARHFQIEHEPIDITGVVESVCDTLDPLADSREVALTLYTDPLIPALVLGDAVRLRQVLLNLVGNAIKFSSTPQHSGRVSVRASVVGSSDRRMLELKVADNGIGMDRENLSRLFSPFAQGDASTTRRFGGTGLGLSISHGLIGLMDGEITVQSAPGQGATFTVLLPLISLPAEAPGSVLKHDLAGLRCLLLGKFRDEVDDLAVYLAHSGAAVHRVADRAAAGEWFGSCAPGLWVGIVTDIDDAQDNRQAETLSRLRAICAARSDLDARFVVIAHGRRRGLRTEAVDLVSVDRDKLRCGVFLKAVALVAGQLAAEPPRETFLPAQATPKLQAFVEERLILVAEDNETNQKVLLSQLALLGLKADIARDGREALAFWLRGDYVLLLTDLRMPEMDGYELAAAIRVAEAGQRRMPIVALSANALADESRRCRNAGMDDYMTKPVPIARLREMLAKWLPDPSGLASPSGAFPLHAPLAVETRLPADLGVLVALIGNDPAVIERMLLAFRASSAQASAALRQGLVGGRGKAAADAAHTLKSGARSIGAYRLGEICVEIEQAVEAGRADAFSELLLRFENELNEVHRFLDAR